MAKKINSKAKGSAGEELWKDVVGYEGLYKVSNHGEIKSLRRRVFHKTFGTKGVPERILKPYTSEHNGYVYVQLCKNGKARTIRFHKIVIQAFIPNENNYDQINHIDGDKTNNNISNLEWCNGSQNMIHAVKTGLQPITSKKVIRLDDGKIYDSLTECAFDNGGKKAGAISRVCKGTRSNYKGKRFAYYTDYINNTIPEFKGKHKRNGVK